MEEELEEELRGDGFKKCERRKKMKREEKGMGEDSKREDEEGGREGNTGGETRQERDIICVTTNFREATYGPEREVK